MSCPVGSGLPRGGSFPRGGVEVNQLHFQLEGCCPEGGRFKEEEWRSVAPNGLDEEE